MIVWVVPVSPTSCFSVETMGTTNFIAIPNLMYYMFNPAGGGSWKFKRVWYKRQPGETNRQVWHRLTGDNAITELSYLFLDAAEDLGP
jgi:hypothetical protein